MTKTKAKRFTNKHPTFDNWYRSQKNKKSAYVKRITRGHSIYPDASLSQLRGHSKKSEVGVKRLTKNILYSDRADLFSKSDKRTKDRILDTIKSMRKGTSLTKACRNNNISPNTFKKYTDSVLYKKKGKYHIKPNDTIVRYMEFWEKGKDKPTTIKPKDFKEASKIGKYMNAVRSWIDFGNPIPIINLAKHKNTRRVYDREGKSHKFELNLKRLTELHEQDEGFVIEIEEIYEEGAYA